MRKWIAAFFTALIGIVAPPRRTEALVTRLSLETLASLTVHTDFGETLPYQDERVRALVWEIKYYANQRALLLAGELLAETLAGVAEEALSKPLLMPVPMHRARLRERGHNQTELLCEAALAHVGDFYEYEPRALVRTVHTPQQQGLPRKRRLENVRGSMEVRAEYAARVTGRTCIVVDDVSTTGATFAECKRALKAAGARSIICVALAH